MSVYPIDTELPDGSLYPGMDEDTGKFSPGDAQAGKKASALPADTINFILDNLDELIMAGLGESDPDDIEQIKNSVIALINNHSSLTENPHDVTKAQVGLGNVPNWFGDTNTSLGESDEAIPSQYAVKTYVDTVVEAAKNELLPIGFPYIQFPGFPNPTDFGLPGTWANVSSVLAGDFIRFEGGAALAFEAGEQAYQNAYHRHTVNNMYSSTGGSTKRSSIYWTESYNNQTTSYNGNVDDPEGRPVNKTVRLWEKESE